MKASQRKNISIALKRHWEQKKSAPVIIKNPIPGHMRSIDAMIEHKINVSVHRYLKRMFGRV